MKVFFFLKSLLRSFPQILVLKFPNTTPSGFNIGTTLITASWRSLIASGRSEQTHFKNPSITKLPLDSPGCCLAIAKIHFFALFGISGSVIVRSCKSSPLKDSQRILCLTMSDRERLIKSWTSRTERLYG